MNYTELTETLQAAPIGTLVTIDSDTVTPELYVRADRSDFPWLLVEDTSEPESQIWLGARDLASYDCEIVYPTGQEPKPEPVDEQTALHGPVVWRSGEAWGGLPIAVRASGSKHVGFVDGVACKHSHRSIDAAAGCAARTEHRMTSTR